MGLIFLVGLTLNGYAFSGAILLSLLTAYIWLSSSNKKEKPGCFSVGLAGLIIWFVLMFPTFISIEIIERGTSVAKIAVVIFWFLVFATVGYFGIAKNPAGLKKILFKIFKYIILSIFLGLFLGLFLVLFFGMAYFLYQRFFTHEKDDAPIWAVFLCIFFVATLILAVFGFLIKNKEADKKEKTTFYDLEKAKLKPEIVVELDLANTKIDVFPHAILQFKNIQYLVLNNNNISEIPNEISQLKLLVGIDLSNNPISDLERNRIRKLLSKEVEIVF